MNTVSGNASCTVTPKLHLLLCLGADFDYAYIAHLCRYYTPAVDSWLVLLHSNDLDELGERVIAKARHKFEASLLNKASEATLSTREWRGEFNSYTKIHHLNDMVREWVPPGEWVLCVDVDEFVQSPGDLKSLATQCLAVQQKVVYGSLVDRFAPGREPHAINDQDDLFSKFPLSENYTKTGMRASTQKPCLMIYEGAPLLRDCHNHTGQSERDYRLSGHPLLTLWHFKWIESTRQKLRHRVQSFQRQGLGHWRESAVCLSDIYKEEVPRHGSRKSTRKFNPSKDLETRAFWKSGVVDGPRARLETFRQNEGSGFANPKPAPWRPQRRGTVDEQDGQRLRVRLGDRALELNPTAALIWERCDGSRTEPEILAELCELFTAPEDLLRRDLRVALNGLIDAGALMTEDQKGPDPAPKAGSSPRIRLGLVTETSVGFLNQVKLCLFSLRKNGGALSKVPVTLITNSEPLGTRETRFFKENFSPIEFTTSPRLGAIPHTSKLNVFYSIEPSSYDVLMFMDCDTVVRGPLDRIAEPIFNGSAQFLCRRGGETDRNRFVDFDALVTRFCGQGRRNRIVHEGTEEWPMFNSGVFLATAEAVRKIRRNSIEFTYQLFNDWQRNNALERLPEALKEQIEIKQDVLESWPVEQGALALACIQAGVKVQYLEGEYNSWGGDPDFRILHCFKSLYKFNRPSMFSHDSEEWIAEYLDSDIPGMVFLASIMLQYKHWFPAPDPQPAVDTPLS